MFFFLLFLVLFTNLQILISVCMCFDVGVYSLGFVLFLVVETSCLGYC